MESRDHAGDRQQRERGWFGNRRISNLVFMAKRVIRVEAKVISNFVQIDQANLAVAIVSRGA